MRSNERRRDPHHPLERGQADRHSDRASQLSHELGVRNRVRRGRDVGAGHGVVFNRAREQPVHVALVNPAHALPPASDRAAKTQASESGKRRERAAVATEHEARAKHDLPHACRGRPRKRVLPRRAHGGREPVAKRRIFVDDNARGRIAVTMRGRHLHPDARQRLHGSERTADHFGGFDARAKDLVAMIGRLDAIDRAAGEIHDRMRAIEMARPVPDRARIPGSVLPPRAGWRQRASRDRDDVVSGFRQMTSQTQAEKSRATGDDDASAHCHMTCCGRGPF